MMAPSVSSRRSTVLVLLLLLAAINHVLANTEKVIFIGPSPVNVPQTKPSLSDLYLHTLTPQTLSVRTELDRLFPSGSQNVAQGYTSWLLLNNLTDGQRYELRVCWSATEPTAFTLDVFGLDLVWDSPELVQSLALYAESRQPHHQPSQENLASRSATEDSEERMTSVLLLRVSAAADYFSDNPELMKNPPPVLVDLILDPFLFNILPQSLLPTVVYIIGVGITAWFVSKKISSMLTFEAQKDSIQEKKNI